MADASAPSRAVTARLRGVHKTYGPVRVLDLPELDLYAGQVVESAPVRELIRNPRHPYTVGLLSSLPRLDTDSRYLVPIPGAPPTLTELKPGCRFADRCPLALDECTEWQTELLEASPGHRSRCLRHEIVSAVDV